MVASIVELPIDRKAISCKWVFKLKHKNGQVDRYKARLVARGFTQQHGIDYFETFSPVVRKETIRILLIIANQLDLLITQIDVKTAFLNGKINEKIYMEQPQGYNKSNLVCKLHKSLYGLKQASMEWNKCFTDFLIAFNLKPLSRDSCVFVNKSCNLNRKEEPILIICIYVDDGLIMSNQRNMIQLCIDHLKNKFEITANRPDTFVGVEISRENDILFMQQKHYTESIVTKYNMDKSNKTSIPINTHLKITKDGLKGSISPATTAPYKQLIGRLNYLSSTTRPDISYAVNILSRYDQNPKVVHWNLLKNVVKYLASNNNLGLINVKNTVQDFELVCFSDADYAGCEDTRKSTSGLVIMLNMTPIMWKSKRQGITTTSTCEAEFVAASIATKEILWTRNILHELGINLDLTHLNIDNMGTITLIENNQIHSKTKHLDVPLHFIRDINKKQITIKHVNTNDNTADIFTKALPRQKFEMFRNKLISKKELAFITSLTILSIIMINGTNAFLFGPTTSIQPYEIELQAKCPCPYILDHNGNLNYEEHKVDINTCKIRPVWDHLECMKRYEHILSYCRLFPTWIMRTKRSVLDYIYTGVLSLPKIAISAGTIIIKSIAEIVGVDEILGLTAARLVNRLITSSNSQRENGTLVPVDLAMEEIARVSTFAGKPNRRSKLRSVAMSQPVATRTFEYIYDELSAAELLVAMLGESIHHGQVDTEALSELSGYKELASINMKDTKIKSITYNQDNDDIEHANITMNYIFDVMINHNLIERIIIMDMIYLMIGVSILSLISIFVYMKRDFLIQRRQTQLDNNTENRTNIHPKHKTGVKLNPDGTSASYVATRSRDLDNSIYNEPIRQG